MQGALETLQQQPYGWILLGIVALGLVAFGAYSLVEAWCRPIDPPDAAGTIMLSRRRVAAGRPLR